MKFTHETRNILTALPIAITIMIFDGLERIGKLWRPKDFPPPLESTTQGAPLEYKAASNEPQLQMKWITVTRNGKQQLRMHWSVPAKSNAARHAA